MSNEAKASEGLQGAEKESSSKEELFSGSLESPEEAKASGSESPQAEGPGKSASESEDSELVGIFTDLEKDIAEELKPRATNVKKKLQGYLTKKTQAFSEKLKNLESNQITDDLKRDYRTLYGWYEKIQTNPTQGLRALASELGISVKELLETSEASQPKSEELTLEQVKADPTAENWAAFTRQEVNKLFEKEVKPLKETLTQFQGNNEKRENVQRGAEAIKDASSIPGFIVEVEGQSVLSEDANKAIKAVLNGEFLGPNALKNAFKAFTADSAATRAKKLETEMTNFKKNLAGVQNPPGTTQKTRTAPSRPEDLWSDLRSEPLSS